MAYQPERSRHTAPFLLSHFLNSKESLQCLWLTPTLISILRYIYDVIEMTYNRTSEPVCKIPIDQIANYSRVGRSSVVRGIKILVEQKFLSVSKNKYRTMRSYGVGEFITMRSPYPLNDRKVVQNITHPNPQTLVDNSINQPQQTYTKTVQVVHGEPLNTPEVVHGEPHIRKSNKKNQERESRGAGAPLSLGSFKPNQEHEALAKTLGVSLDKELDSFRNLYAGKSTNYDYAFTRWLHCAKEYRDKKATMAAMKATTRPVVEEPVRPRGEDWTKTNFAPSIRSVESILTEQSLIPPKPPTPEELAAEAARLERRKLVVMFTLEERMRFVSEGIFEEKLRDAAKGDFSWRESGQKNKGTSLSG